MMINMVKENPIKRVPYFIEIIHVKLPNKRVVIGVLEILW